MLWLGSGRRYRVEYEVYATYLDESVAGLNVNAPVRYHGVAVGSVREIGLDPADPSRVRLLLDLERGTPVKEDTIATLSVQGLTGIAYLDLGGGTAEAPLLVARPGQPHPVIESSPSLMARVQSGVTTLLVNLDETFQRLTLQEIGRLTGTATASYNPAPWLTTRATLGIDVINLSVGEGWVSDYATRGLLLEALYQRALTIWEKALGSDHPRVALVLQNMAKLYKETTRVDEAKRLEARTKPIRSKDQ